jgi:hypothetical protein
MTRPSGTPEHLQEKDTSGPRIAEFTVCDWKSSSGARRELSRTPLGEHGVAALVLLALVMIGQHDVVFRGRSLVHSNYSNPFDYRPLPQNYGPELVPHEEWTSRNLWPFANLRDPGAVWWQWEPSTAFLKQAIADREWPFWDPYVAAGTPAMANLIPAFFFPPYLMAVALGASARVMTLYALLLLWGASFATFLFLRAHGLSRLASLGGGAIVIMGGSMNQNLGSFSGQTVACLPWALYATRLALDEPSRLRLAIVTIAYAGAALASFPPVLLGVLGIVAFYAVTAIVTGDCATQRLVIAIRWGAAVALAIGLVAFYYVPAFALGRAVPHVAAMYRGAGLEVMPVRNVYQLLSPTVMDGVQVYLAGVFASTGSAAHIPYVGVVCTMALLLARPADGRRGRSLFVVSAAGAALILLKLFGVPPIQWVGYLPLLSQIHFSHYLGVPLGFLLAFLGAQGIEVLVRGRASRVRTVAIVAAAVIAIEALWWFAAGTGDFKKEAASYWLRDWRVVGLMTIAVSILLTSARFADPAPRVRTAIAMILLALIAVEGLYNNTYPRPKPWNTFEHPVPYVQTLQRAADAKRILAFGMPPANSNEAFGISVLDSLMAYNPPRVFELYKRYSGSPPEVFMRQAGQIPPEGVLDRANIGFVGTYTALTRFVSEGDKRGYRRRFEDGFVTIFERPTLPRFFFSSEYRVGSKADALQAIASSPSREIVLEQEPGFKAAQNSADDPAIRIETLRRNSSTVIVDAPRPGLVYAAESFFDGWTARVNGVPSPILPANYAFRAVAVPAGRSRIEFRYWPPGLTAGLAISAVSFVALLVWIAVPFVELDRRRREAAQN